MFLLERLVGVGVYSLLLVLVCFSLVGKSSKKIKKRLFIYSIILSVLAYNYVPYETADLYRIYKAIESFGKYSFGEFWRIQTSGSQLDMANIIYWLVGQTGHPHLLPAINAFVCYSCVFYIIRKTAEKNKISGKNVALALLFYMSTETYLSIIGGIRSMLGVSLLAFCFYREHCEKKFNIFHIFLYIISFLIHSFTAILVILRFIIPIFTSSKTPPGRRLIYMLFLGISVIFMFRYLGNYLDSVISKAEGYIEGGGYTYFWGYIIDVIAWISMIAVVLRYYRYKQKEYTIEYGAFCKYLLVCLLTALVFCFEYSIFTRLILHISPIICLPILMVVLQKNDDTYGNKQIAKKRSLQYRRDDFNSFFTFISVMFLLLSCARGEMSSLKFFVL